jgi:tRNA uridine 5-carboxymethylaminomethyl modification enzyme
LEKVEIVRPGYAVEYDFVPPIQLHPTLETKLIKGLFHAGQINGTSGYEEAGAQGIIAGINAANIVLGKDTVVLDRSQAYIGVMIDDLVTKGTMEPYRMFTSRAEYRLILREDNADLRLREIGFANGLVDQDVVQIVRKKKEGLNRLLAFLDKKGLKQALKRPEITIDNLSANNKEILNAPAEVREQAEIQVKYEGYIDRQMDQIERFKKAESLRIPADINYNNLPGLSTEAREKLSKIRPISLGQASRVAGIPPSAISILHIHTVKAKKGGLCGV